YVFGVSGANIEHLHDAIHRLGGDRLVSVMAKSEFGAAFMADGYARVHRRLGVCCAASGGGLFDLAGGIAGSYAEPVALLAFVGQPPGRGEGRGAFQDSSGIGRTVDAMAVFSGIAKLVIKIAQAEEFWPAMERAAVAALGGRPGPAVLLVPRSSWSAEVAPVPADFAETVRAAICPVAVDRLGPPPMVDAAAQDAPRDPFQPRLVIRPQAPADANAAPGPMRAFLEDLRGARHPVLIVGQGVRRCSDPAAVIEFARAVRLPMMTDVSARGEVPNDDPLYFGLLGVAGHPSAHAYLRDHADLLLIVGSGLNAMTRGPLMSDPVDIGTKKIIAVNIDMGELSRALQPPARNLQRSWWPGTAEGLAIAVEADAGVVFEELLRLWRASPFELPPAAPYRFKTFLPALAPAIPPATTPVDGTLLQSEALDLLQRVLPRGGHIVYDAGNCAAAALHQLYVPPGTSATIALGMGGMGYAIAAAIGIALGSTKDQRTIVL